MVLDWSTLPTTSFHFFHVTCEILETNYYNCDNLIQFQMEQMNNHSHVDHTKVNAYLDCDKISLLAFYNLLFSGFDQLFQPGLSRSSKK